MKFSAIIFDMDGVLVDNNDFHYRSFEVFCKKYKLTLTPEIYNTFITGRTNEMILKYFFGENITPSEVEQLTYEKEALYRELYKPYIKPAPGLANFLETSFEKGIKFAVASNGPIENIDFVLDETNIRSYFSVIVNASMVKQGKPAPDIYLKAAEMLGKDTKDCVVFEDSPTGIRAALAAHIKVIGLTTTHAPHELIGTEFVVKDFSDDRLNEIV
ncbi:MAG TPA: HAD family phosphatase [Cytophagaceae bacterium]|nr:HAD family phosphatase [Cytophagaceae bacterium]